MLFEEINCIILLLIYVYSFLSILIFDRIAKFDLLYKKTIRNIEK